VAKLRPVGHADQISLVDHLDELRTRLVLSLVVLGVAFGLCLWQNHYILQVVNQPLRVAGTPLGAQGKPVTLGVAEQFTTTLTLAAYAAILLTLPLLLYQIYAFVLPAFSPTERRVALPLLLMVPFLFVGGVVFGYFVLVPKALQFLLSFNADEYTTLVRAREYHSFLAQTLIAIGVLFQIPVGILAATKLGLTTPAKLRKHRRYSILGIAVVAMLLPGQDPVTMLIAMVPLVVLYEASILLAVFFGRSKIDRGGEDDEDDDFGDPDDPEPPDPEGGGGTAAGNGNGSDPEVPDRLPAPASS
jgi:sec-independent protein translocase protein TatC